ncbi:MAG TPA: hypothetical protein VKW70_04640 [Terriglobia bacterium]|nr:hypothetical protein [Terriglobia bacterium]
MQRIYQWLVILSEDAMSLRLTKPLRYHPRESGGLDGFPLARE